MKKYQMNTLLSAFGYQSKCFEAHCKCARQKKRLTSEFVEDWYALQKRASEGDVY